MRYNDNSNWYVSSETGSEPVSLEDVKAHLNVTFDDDDDYLSSLVSVCREIAERHCGISIKAKTVVCYLRNECGGVDLPFGPVYQITEAKDILGNDVQLITIGDKYVSIILPETDYLKVTYTCGYQRFGNNAVPALIRHAILEEIAWRYNNRGSVDGIGSSQAKNLLSPFKRKSWLI